MPGLENGHNTTAINPACNNRKPGPSQQFAARTTSSMQDQPENPDCAICSPAAIAGRRFTDMRRFLTGGVPYWRFLWREHAGEILGSAD